MTVTILSVLVLLSGLVPPDADRLGLWDAACVATGALDAQGVIDGAPPCLGVLCWDLSQLDVDANLVLPHVLWYVCHDDVLVNGCLCLKLYWPGKASQPRPIKTKTSTLVLENSQCCSIFKLYYSPCSCTCPY